eukprot:CAMPEP_0203900116 /NCGR_PEP_ID=MMETSP0359-20131031/42428_1 /ASSEMBLY_ACC=CAM_ASM_000338 /TAXON_ID=268821 /ORGANISM="Scrippsiella Hangoei, Strain SHTV-5" /LENGTH=1216 /DNA_ID=CAMNT_0050823501 /DNA_START=45 /DNA_END=3692 /DNA_ORIENTATION=+
MAQAPGDPSISWTGSTWVAKVLREQRRVKVIDAYRRTIIMPPLAAIAEAPVGYKKILADSGLVFASLTESVLSPPHLNIDTLMDLVRGFQECEKSVSSGLEVAGKFRGLVEAAGGDRPSEDIHLNLLEEIGVTTPIAIGFLQSLSKLALPRQALMSATTESLANLDVAATPADIRDIIGTRCAGEIIVSTLFQDSHFDWKSDAIREASLDVVLGNIGIPLCQMRRSELLGMFNSTIRELPNVYSLGGMLRLIFGPDQVARSLVQHHEQVEVEVIGTTGSSSSTASIAKLVSGLDRICGKRVATRISLLQMGGEDASSSYDVVRVAMRVHGSGDEVLDWLVSRASQAVFTRLLSFLCGGLCVPNNAPGSGLAAPSCEGEDLRSQFGWTGLVGVRLAKHAPRLFGHEAIFAEDLKVVARCVAGLAIPEESLSALIEALDPENVGSIPCERFLRALHRRRLFLIEGALCDSAEATRTSPERLGPLIASAASDGTVPIASFLTEAPRHLPEIKTDLWTMLADAFNMAVAPLAASSASLSGSPIVASQRVNVRAFVQEVQHLTRKPKVQARRIGGASSPADGPEVTRDLLRVLHGAREAVLQSCSDADTARFGTLPRDTFVAAVAKANIVLSQKEKEALAAFADLRGDGQVPYRLAMHRAELESGNATVPARRCTLNTQLLKLADVGDFWSTVAHALHDRHLEVAEIFIPMLGTPKFEGCDVVSRNVFMDAIERLGITTGVPESPIACRTSRGGEGSSFGLPATTHPPRIGDDLRLATSRDLAGEAWQELDANHAGWATMPVLQKRIERGASELQEARQDADAQVMNKYGRYIPKDLFPRVRGNASLVAALLSVASDLEAQHLSAFEAFARLDSRRKCGVVSGPDFCEGLLALAPTVSLKQAEELLQLMLELPFGDEHEFGAAAAGSSTRILGEVRLSQFERVFPLRAPETILKKPELLPVQVTTDVWLDSIADRMVSFLQSHGMSPDQMFNNMDSSCSGRLAEADFLQFVAQSRLGISPGEARVLFAAMQFESGEVASTAPTYRGFVGVLHNSYERAHAKEESASRNALSVTPPPQAMGGFDLVDMFSRKLHLVDPSLKKVFRRFAMQGKLTRAMFPDLINHLGLKLSRAQSWLLWKELDPNNTTTVDEQSWLNLFRVAASIEVPWSSIFNRLESACLEHGLPLETCLGDLDLDGAGWLSAGAARRIFAKVRVAANEREI